MNLHFNSNCQTMKLLLAFFLLFLVSNPNALPGYSCHSHPRRGHEGSRLEELLRSPDSRDVLRRLAEDGVKLRLLTKLTIQMKIEESSGEKR